MSLLPLYIRDRLGLVAAWLTATGLVLLLVFLLIPAAALRPADLAYAYLLSVTVLAIYLAADLARWWPYAAALTRLQQESATLDDLSGLPRAGTAEQALSLGLLAQLHRLAVAERSRLREEHRRHLTFINLWVHQMKTPVAGIHLIAQQGAADPSPEVRTALARVEDEAARMAEGLDLVLHMARLEHFAADYRIERVDLLQSVRQVINQRKRQFIRLSIFPEVQVDGEGEFAVLTDDKWNRMAIDQIVANALKYGAQGGRPGQRLRFVLVRTEGAVWLTVADEGPGIPPEDLPRVFEPFFTGQNGRRFADATGVGLWLVREVLDRLGHGIAIESVPGTGTAVTLTYPDRR